MSQHDGISHLLRMCFRMRVPHGPNVPEDALRDAGSLLLKVPAGQWHALPLQSGAGYVFDAMRDLPNEQQVAFGFYCRHQVRSARFHQPMLPRIACAFAL